MTEGITRWRREFTHDFERIVFDDDTIYLGTTGDEHGVAAVDGETGEERWRLGLDDWESAPGLSPAGEHLVLDSREDGLLVVEAASGTIRWRKPDIKRSNEMWLAALFVACGAVFGEPRRSTDAYSDVVVLDLETGTVRWGFDCDDTGGYVGRARDGVVYLTDQIPPAERTPNGPFAHGMRAIEVESGRERWRFEEPMDAAPTTLDDRVVFGCRTKEGRDPEVTAINAATGDRLWSASLLEPLSGVPIAHDQEIYAQDEGGRTYRLDPDSGEVRWRDSPDPPTKWVVDRTDGAVLLWTADSTLRAVDRGSGEPVWEFDGLDQWGAFDTDGGTIVGASSVDRLVAIDAGSGEIRWETDPFPDAFSLLGVYLEGGLCGLHWHDEEGRNALRVFDAESGEEVRAYEGVSCPPAFSEGGWTYVASGSTVHALGRESPQAGGTVRSEPRDEATERESAERESSEPDADPRELPGNPTPDEMVEFLDHDDPELRKRAGEDLLDVAADRPHELGPLVDELLAGFDHDDPTVRKRVATALGHVGGEEVLERLRDVRLDPAVEVSEAARDAIARIRDE